jgi:hypothetical protein
VQCRSGIAVKRTSLNGPTVAIFFGPKRTIALLPVATQRREISFLSGYSFGLIFVVV